MSDLKSHSEKMNKEKYDSHETEVIDDIKAVTEKIMMGLRLAEGVSISELKEKFGYDILNEKEKSLTDYSNAELIKIENDRIVISEKGLYISDSIIIGLI